MLLVGVMELQGENKKGGKYMDIDKMVKEIKKDFNNRCDQCTYKDKICGNEMCSIGIREWLEKEWLSEDRNCR